MCEPHVEPRGETVTAKSGAARHGAIKRCHVGGAVAIVVTCGGVGPCSARASRRGHLNHCGCIRHGRGRHGTPSSVRTHSHGRHVGRGGPTALASVRDTGRQASFSRQRRWHGRWVRSHYRFAALFSHVLPVHLCCFINHLLFIKSGFPVFIYNSV